MESIAGVDTATQFNVHLYHQDGANMAYYISLWNATETVQYGTEQQITNSPTAQWDTVIISGLSLTQTQLDDVRIRVRHTRPAGGKANSSLAFAMYADVTYTPVIDVTVSATGTQQNVTAGTNNEYIGGTFVITENTNTRNITSITISETGTVNAQTNLNDVRIYYEFDTTLPYNCESESYAGSEAQYGATSTSFSSANGTSTFTGSVSISTTSTMCAYVVLDVSNEAAAGETIEVQITDPTTDVIGSGSPVISPATAVALQNTSTINKVNLTQIHYHWRNDDGNEADPGGATSATGGVDDTTFDSFPQAVIQRLRVEVSNEGNTTSASTQYRLEYAEKVTSCSVATGWTDVGAVGGDWDMAGTGSGLTEGSNTTDIAESIGGVQNENSTFVGTAGQKETSSQTSGLALTATEFYEIEYAIIASSTASQGTTYCFRVTNAGTAIDTYTSYPEATIAADLFVNATGTQVSNITIPTQNAYNGGGFVITDGSAGAHTITDITITASGTVDFQNDISNLVLFYETDTVAPYDCTGESFNGDETQYGATSTNGFSAAATSTFSGSISVSPTQGICLYVQYNVDIEASDGETIEVRIADASTDIIINTGSISPAALVDISGVTLLTKDIIVQQHYHWRNDDGNEADPGGATSATGGVDDTPLLEMTKGQHYRLRFGLSNEGSGTSPSRTFRLEWGQKISTCSAVTVWTDVGATDDKFNMTGSPNFTDGDTTTNIAEGIGGVADEATTFFGSNGGMKDLFSETAGISLPGDNHVDLEFNFLASTTALEGITYCFRITDAGTALSSYNAYAEATIKLATDFFVQRGIVNIQNGSTTATLTAGTHYTPPISSSRAFIRITNTQITGGGPSAGTTGNHNADEVTAYITNPGNILSSITFARGGTANDTQIAWEIVEYTGAIGGDNEIIVRQQATLTYVSANTTVTTGTISGIVDDNDVAVFVTGQYNPDAGRFDYNTVLSTASWNAGADTATFTRGEAGGDAVIVSYAAVEFVGANWGVQRVEHTYTAAGVASTTPITAVGSLSRAFIHAQHRAGANEDQHGDFGHEAWLSSVGQVSFRLNASAQTPSLHTSVVWVIENTQVTGDIMEVTRSNGTIADGGGGLTTTNISIGKTLDDLTVSSIFTNNSNSNTGRSFPESIIRVRLISTTQYEFAISDDAGDNLYRTEVVELPTASRKLAQNFYRFYATSSSLTPTDPWPPGPTDLGENFEVTGSDSPISSGESFRLRISLLVSNASLPANADAYRLEFGERVSTCSAITEWFQLGATGSTTALWRGSSTPLTDGATLPSTLLSVSDVTGTFEEENPTALNPSLVAVNNDIEYDWSIENNGAKDKTSYCFRMTEADGTVFLNGYNNYPVMRTVGYGAESQAWKWFDDVDIETPTIALAATNTAPIDIDYNNDIGLRITLKESSGAVGNNIKFKLQFSESSTFATTTDVAEIGDCINTSYWCYTNGGGVDDDLITTRILGDADACVGQTGNGCGTHNESGTTSSTFTHASNAASEFSFAIKSSGARVNTVYYFRVYDVTNNEAVPLASGASYPSLITKGASMIFTMQGVASSTTIEGVTTDVDSSPTAVTFGSVPVDIYWEAVHRFVVDTNATEGYQIFMTMDADLLNTSGERIEQITSTNASPNAWTTACPALNLSCFGYHTSDDTLFGGSTRFSAIDTYARVSTTTYEEVAYSSQPEGGDVIDIVFRIFVTDQQAPGDYEANIKYVSVPMF